MNTFNIKDPLKKKKAKRIEGYVNQNGCFICTSHSICNNGMYYRIKRNGKMMLLHRYVYESYKGYILDGMSVRHICDNSLCVNPDHLIIGSHKENMVDRSDRDRTAKGSKNGKSKLNEKEVLEIKLDKTSSNASLAKMYNVTGETIRAIRSNETWKHV